MGRLQRYQQLRRQKRSVSRTAALVSIVTVASLAQFTGATYGLVSASTKTQSTTFHAASIFPRQVRDIVSQADALAREIQIDAQNIHTLLLQCQNADQQNKLSDSSWLKDASAKLQEAEQAETALQNTLQPLRAASEALRSEIFSTRSRIQAFQQGQADSREMADAVSELNSLQLVINYVLPGLSQGQSDQQAALDGVSAAEREVQQINACISDEKEHATATQPVSTEGSDDQQSHSPDSK